MIPIDLFTEFSKSCADRPFLLLEKKDQEVYLEKLKKSLEKIKTTLETTELQDTKIYALTIAMIGAVSAENVDEAKFSEALGEIDTIIGKEMDPKVKEKILTMDLFAERFRKRATEFHIYEERIKKETEKMSAEQIREHDKKVFQDIGSFYVWEYTLTIQQEMEKANDADKEALLKTGLRVKAGNLPGLLPLIESLRQEFAFKIYDRDTRWDILRTFFDFQLEAEKNNIEEILKALKKLNKKLLEFAIKTGLTTFKGMFYYPYPDETSYESIIKQIDKRENICYNERNKK